MSGQEVEPIFVHHLHHALKHLYDPAELRASPLTILAESGRHTDPATTLRHILVQAIGALKPAQDVPDHSTLWRDYHILFSRFTEQFLQQEVATDLGLSVRQLRRQEKLAVDALATYLWLAHDLGDKFTGMEAADASLETTKPPVPGLKEELDWLHESASDRLADIDQLIQTAISTVAPLCASHGNQVRYEGSALSQRFASQPAMIQQAVLNILTTAIRQNSGETITIELGSQSDVLDIRVHPIDIHHLDDDEAVRMARDLVELCNGRLAIEGQATQGHPAAVLLSLPIVSQTHVLVIDDNPDTLRLFQRYSSGTRYRITGIQDAARAVQRAAELLPRIIVLDVMMPGVDGWELLGRLREHPQLRGTSVIVATIMPQEQLALALGAAAFVRKPLSRDTFLMALDAQSSQRTVSGSR